MRDRKYSDKDLDAIGRRLIEGSRLREAEIESIVASPGLFEGVRARIAAEAAGGPRPAALRPYISFGKYRAILGSAAAVVVFLSGLFIYTQRSAQVVSNTGSHPVPVVPQPAFTSQAIVQGFTQGRAEFDETAAQPPTPQRAIHRLPEPDRPTVLKASRGREASPEFVAVTYTGDGGESARGGRVVRIDVPRSTLFAMGIDLPLENESPTLKADLLIGPDGVTRAIRLVE